MEHQDQFLKGRTALITGGLTGQGFAIARSLASHGANIGVGSFIGGEADGGLDAAHYPDEREFRDAVSKLRAIGPTVYADHLDVRDSEMVNRFVSAASEAAGPADILVNAAGTTAEQGVCGHSDELWNRIVETNLSGAFRMIRACLPAMIERAWGRIINVGSTAATMGWKDNPAYCASKSGLLGLTRCVALEGAPHGVTCVMISPTWVNTELMRKNTAQIAAREGERRTRRDVFANILASNPQGRIIQPEEVASLAVYLCRDISAGITNENIQVSGGALW